MEDKEKKDLTEEERVGVKKIANILARFVLDEIEQEKRKSNAMQSKKQRARTLAGGLFYAFNWNDTKEGYDYWNSVHDRLIRIAEAGF